MHQQRCLSQYHESIASNLNANVQDYKNILSIQSEMTNAEAIIQRGD